MRKNRNKFMQYLKALSMETGFLFKIKYILFILLLKLIIL